MLDGREAARRFPMISLSGNPVLYQPDSGIVHAERALEAFRDGARAAGAIIREQATVTHLDLSGADAVIRLEGETIRARVAVITAGAWAKDLLGQIGYELDVRPTRETVAYFDMEGLVPPTLVEWGDPAAYSLLDPRTGGLKAGEHVAGPTTDPNEEGIVHEGSVERIAAWVGERFPHAKPVPIHSETCIYTNTPDEHFVLDRRGPFVVGSPCSGHGFKFAPLIGQRLATLAAR